MSPPQEIALTLARHLEVRPTERTPILWDREQGVWWGVRSSTRGLRLTRQAHRQRLIVVHTAPDRHAMIALLESMAAQSTDI